MCFVTWTTISLGHATAPPRMRGKITNNKDANLAQWADTLCSWDLNELIGSKLLC